MQLKTNLVQYLEQRIQHHANQHRKFLSLADACAPDGQERDAYRSMAAQAFDAKRECELMFAAVVAESNAQANNEAVKLGLGANFVIAAIESCRDMEQLGNAMLLRGHFEAVFPDSALRQCWLNTFALTISNKEVALKTMFIPKS